MRGSIDTLQDRRVVVQGTQIWRLHEWFCADARDVATLTIQNTGILFLVVIIIFLYLFVRTYRRSGISANFQISLLFP